PPIWVGGVSDAAVGVAARLADAWNGWGLPLQAFDEKVKLLYQLMGDRAVEATWGGVVLIGEDRLDVRRQVDARAARNLPAPAMAGTPKEVAAFFRDLSEAGATWVTVLLAGSADRRMLLA